MKIRWTPTARITYFKILDHLAEKWTTREITNFADEVENVPAVNNACVLAIERSIILNCT
jgi:hypothetical protein